MIITQEYLNKHKTKRGAWTSKQLRILGIDWPPVKGWQNDIDGHVITDKMALEFENAKFTTRKINKNKMSH